MVVSAHVEIRVRFAPIPAKDFVRVETFTLPAPGTSGICFRKPQPAARNHCVSFQQFERTGRAHLGRNYAGDVFFERNIVDNRQPGRSFHEAKSSPEYLALLAFPMKSDSDRNVVQRKRARLRVRRSKCYFRRKAMPPGSVRLANGIGKGPR